MCPKTWSMGVVTVGIDPSYACTALVAMDGFTSSYRADVATKAGKHPHPERIAHIRDRVLTFVDEWQPVMVAIEGYSFGSKTNREMLGELGGVIRVALFEAGFSYAIVSPSTLKKYVTGSGKGDKALILREVYRRWRYDAVDDNDADAFGLARLAQEMYGQPRGQWTKKLEDLAKKIEIVGAS